MQKSYRIWRKITGAEGVNTFSIKLRSRTY